MSELTPPSVVDDGAEGLGRPPAVPILTLPPVPSAPKGIQISETTGQPRRNPVMIIANVFLYAAAANSAVALGTFWWLAMHMNTFPNSAHLIELVNPTPGSAQSVFCAIGVMVMGALSVAAPSIAAFNSWNGHRWSRVAAIVATLLGALAYFLHPWAWYSIPFSALGAVTLWLPPVGKYFENWRLFRNPDKPLGRDITHVVYGPVSKFHRLDSYLATPNTSMETSTPITLD